MQILKSKKDRIGESRYVRRDTHYQDVSLDQKVNLSKALKRSSKQYVNEEGKTATEVMKEMVDKQVHTFAEKFPPNFARYQYPHLTVITGKDITWNLTALLVLFSDMTGYGNSHSMEYRSFISFMEKEVLAYGGYTDDEVSLLDIISIEECVDRVLENINKGN